MKAGDCFQEKMVTGYIELAVQSADNNKTVRNWRWVGRQIKYFPDAFAP